MRLSDIMVYSPVTLNAGDSLDKAISLMEEHGVHHLPVVRDRSPIGMISDRDLLLSVGWKLSGDRKLDRSRADLAGPSLVSEVMSTPVISVDVDATVKQAARQLVDHRINAVVVTRGESLVGVVTTFDLLAAIPAMQESLPGTDRFDEPVQDHMRTNVASVGPKATIESAIALMAEKRIRHIPIVAGDALLGIVSDRDFRREYGAEQVEDEQAQAQGKLFIPGCTVMEIMNLDVHTTEMRTPLVKASKLMVTHRIGALPVIYDEKVVGIITDTDLIRLIACIED